MALTPVRAAIFAAKTCAISWNMKRAKMPYNNTLAAKISHPCEIC